MQMFDQLYSSLIILELSAIGILGVKKAAGASLLIPLLIATCVWRYVIEHKLGRPLLELSMHTAADLDRQHLVRSLVLVLWRSPRGLHRCFPQYLVDI